MSAQGSGGREARVTAASVRAMKAAGRRVVAVTAYDTPGGRLADEAGVDIVLVGDSLGMTVLGYDSTLPVTVDDMIRHTAAVSRGVRHALVVGDMPFLSYQVSPKDALRNAGRFLAEADAAAVKLEGGAEMAPTVARLVQSGIPVMGHVGLTPQSVHQLGGYKVQAKEAAAALKLLEDCLELQEAGAFAVVLECIPSELAEQASRELAIPTIGIGAGVGCDGEIQVFHDLLGYGPSFKPRHAKRFAEIGDAVRSALAAYAEEVRDGTFPGDEHCTRMDPETLRQLLDARAGLGTVEGGD